MPGFRPRFFISPVFRSDGSSGTIDEPEGIVLVLSPEDSHHALRVLRMAEGDTCEVVVGAAVYAASVVTASDPVEVSLTARLEGSEAGAAYRVSVGLVQALARPAAMDYVIEKGTEVGAGFFLLVQSAGSPKRPGLPSGERVARWRRIAQEAAKQSKQSAVPRIDVVESVSEALHVLPEYSALSAVLKPGATRGLHEMLSVARPSPSRVALWIGPESGWSVAESECFSSAGVEAAKLGRSILRTETAGPVGIAVARLALGDW